MLALLVLCAVAGAAGVRAERTRYMFYRDMEKESGRRGWEGTRRVFGGAAAELSEFPAACALLDRYWATRCSGSVLALRWVLTAAHCVSPHLAYVKYNTRQPAGRDGQAATVLFLYRHPKYKVVQEDEGRGMDVTVLHHDVGLVRTRDDILLPLRAPLNPVAQMRAHNPVDLHNKEIKVLGFGRTEQGELGEQLFGAQLKLVFCERGAWFHCMCGVATPAARAAGTALRAAGVCSGDSGGPVLYNGVQVGVTSMGPLECSAVSAEPAASATSVFTALYHYADLVNATITGADQALQMKPLAAAPPATRPPHTLIYLLGLCLLVVYR